MHLLGQYQVMNFSIQVDLWMPFNQHWTLLPTRDVAVAQPLHPAFLRQFQGRCCEWSGASPREEVQMYEQTSETSWLLVK